MERERQEEQQCSLSVHSYKQQYQAFGVGEGWTWQHHVDHVSLHVGVYDDKRKTADERTSSRLRKGLKAPFPGWEVRTLLPCGKLPVFPDTTLDALNGALQSSVFQKEIRRYTLAVGQGRTPSEKEQGKDDESGLITIPFFCLNPDMEKCDKKDVDAVDGCRVEEWVEGDVDCAFPERVFRPEDMLQYHLANSRENEEYKKQFCYSGVGKMMEKVTEVTRLIPPGRNGKRPGLKEGALVGLAVPERLLTQSKVYVASDIARIKDQKKKAKQGGMATGSWKGSGRGGQWSAEMTKKKLRFEEERRKTMGWGTRKKTEGSSAEEESEAQECGEEEESEEEKWEEEEERDDEDLVGEETEEGDSSSEEESDTELGAWRRNMRKRARREQTGQRKQKKEQKGWKKGAAGRQRYGPEDEDEEEEEEAESEEDEEKENNLGGKGVKREVESGRSPARGWKKKKQ